MHPVVLSLQKVCTKSFTFVPKNGNKIVTIEEGTPVVLPLFGLHRDSKYYEQPNVFKRERFVGNNKDNVNKYTFLPSGEGPRACLGTRLL
jgi:cytochrome P450